MSIDNSQAELTLSNFGKASVDVETVGRELQDAGAKSFVKSWDELMGVITSKSAALKQAVAS